MISIGIVRPDPDTAVLILSAHLTSLQNYALGISNIIIAFTGHTAYFSFISELRQPTDFPKSLALLQTICVTAYVVVAVVIYAFAGAGVKSPALSSTGPVIRKISYAIAVPTIVVAGVVNAHVCVKNIYVRMWRGTDVMHQSDIRGLGSWYALCFGTYVLAFIIAEVIPVFNDLLGILGALFCTWFSLGFPAVFWLAMNKRRYGKGKRKVALTVLNVVIFVISAVVVSISD